MKRFLTALTAVASLSTAAAELDYHLVPQQVAPNVYVFVGKTEDFTQANGGNIVNTGFIVAPDGVIVVDTGPSLRYGKQMRAAIATVTDKPVVLALNTHHHPDHFLGNQAFAGVPIATLAQIQAGIRTEGNAFAENLFRMSGSWMTGTEVVVPDKTIEAGELSIAGVKLRILALDGHTGADLALYDPADSVLFTGDLVFNRRAPTTPHANIPHWQTSLVTLEQFVADNRIKVLVPGHGAVSSDVAPIRWTGGWLRWLTGRLRQSAEQGLDMNETIAQPLPAEYQGVPLTQNEYRRSVEVLFPRFEEESLHAPELKSR